MSTLRIASNRESGFFQSIQSSKRPTSREQVGARSLNTKIRSLVTSALLAGSLVGHSAQAELDYDFNFEPGTDIEASFNCSGNCPTISADYAREGKTSSKSYVNRLTSEVSYRSEIKLKGGFDGPQKMTAEKDYWIGVSILLPPGWTHSGGTGMVANIHGSRDPGESTGSVPFEIRSGKGDWQIISRGENVQTKTYTLNSAYEDVGRWVDWVIHFKPSPTSRGILEVWKDGALVVSQTGRPSSTDDLIGPYWKMGVYEPWRDRNCCNDIPAEKVVYHDALRIASGSLARYEDVAPRDNATISSPSETVQQEEAVMVPQTDSSFPVTYEQIDAPLSTADELYVRILDVTEKQALSGIVNLTVDAGAPDGIDRVTLWADRTQLGVLSTAPYSFSFDTRHYSGRVRLMAVAVDNKGNLERHTIRVPVQ